MPWESAYAYKPLIGSCVHASPIHTHLPGYLTDHSYSKRRRLSPGTRIQHWDC